MLASQLPLPKHFAWQALVLQSALLGLYQPALPLWNTLLFLLLLVWQAYRLHQQQQPLTKQQINWLIAPLLLLLLLQVRQLGVLNLMLHILLLAAIGRGFTLKQRYDAVQLIWVQYFALTCAFIFYQQIAVALLIFALLGLNLYLQHRLFAPAQSALQPRRLALITLLTLPLWLGLFLLFPRLPPLWQMPNQNIASSGLSDRLDPGSIERLVQSDALAFRVSFQTARPAREDWYWRAKVYEDFDGRSWQVNARINASQANIRPQSNESANPRLDYQILAEPSYQRDLYSLGLPVSWPATLRARPAALLATPLPLTQRISYALSSELTAVPLGSAEERQLNLQQHSANPQARQFGQQLASQYQGNAASIVQALTAYFQQQAFYYSLTPPLLGNNAIDQFLFESRIGFCSHYASAAAVILRSAGIPARVVGGYQGGEWQQSQQYLLVRQREAHAWVEYLVDDSWQRFDPTAAIAPERILAGLEQTLNLSDRALLSGWQDNWLGQLALQWSHIDYLWSVWVLGFNQQDQQQFWQRLLRWPYWLWLLTMITSLLLLSLAYGLWLKWPIQQHSAFRARYWLCKTLGSQPATGVTVSSWLSSLAENNPQLAELLLEIRRLYERSVFANDTAAEQMLLHKLKQHRRLLRQRLT